ncbi:hypothetical protein C8F04DRAFT_1146297 [Mycena alexandri]|uniref:Uncharacterized protein n=1 Tax=Mycena alexandri TaxID=1745969 RepID=A0AAD6WP26_9AGAR|nr:hypothetical protein C8F04DRAFT_1146297 [Mycena alexandri]
MSTINRDQSELPPKREKPALASVERPLKYTRLNRLIYLLILLSTLLSAYYGYRVVQWKTEVGGWWNLAVGKRPPQLKYEGGERPKAKKAKKAKDTGETVEDRINALADALGMPSRDLASAIAGAVKQYVPPASLSSVAAHQTGEAVDTLLKETEKTDEQRKTEKDAEGSGGIAEGIASGMGSFVGMDEP